MALFPEVEFDLLVAGGAIVTGRSTDAILVVKTAHAIPRVDHLDLTFRSLLFVDDDPPYGERKHPIFEQRVRFELPEVLEAGTHRLPFAFAIPDSLPPAFAGNGITVTHQVHATLAVGWAASPQAEIRAVVELPPRDGLRAPVTVRSPRDFHSSIIVEVTLESGVVAHGESVLGTVRIVGGADREFDGIELSLTSTVAHLAGRNEPRRSMFDSRVFVESRSLVGGDAAPFEAPLPPFAPPSFESPLLRHQVSLAVRLVRQPSKPRSFVIPVEVLPKGSRVRSDTRVEPPLDHRRRWRRAIADATELLAGTGNVIAHGQFGPVHVRIRVADRPQSGLAIELQIYGEPPESLELVSLADDDDGMAVAAAAAAASRAKSLAQALSERPFPEGLPESACIAWRAASAGAHLIPSVPAIHGLLFPLRLLGNRERSIAVSVCTIGPQRMVEVTIDLREMPLVEDAIGPLQNGDYPAGLKSIEPMFPSLAVSANGDTLTLRRSSWSADPRTFYPVIEAVLDWALATRGERRAAAAYR